MQDFHRKISQTSLCFVYKIELADEIKIVGVEQFHGKMKVNKYRIQYTNI